MTDYYKPTEHSQKDDCNEMQYIDPDEVRIEKLEGLVDYQFRRLSWTTPIADRLKRCLDNINCESEHYTTEEIKDALLGHFIHDDIIQFLLTNYMENL